jgi:hypothetical protein
MPPATHPIHFDRQKHLLGLLHALGGAVGNVDFQKLLLLYCAEQGESPSYEFVPYRFGAFSFTSYADRRTLIGRGLLDDDERAWRLSPEGRTQANRIRIGADHAKRLAVTYRRVRGDALVAETYRRFPYYAIRSEIADRVLRDDAATRLGIERARPVRAASGIFTIGYEGRTLEAYLNVLLLAGATLLCDVRRNPISRKYGFSRSTLAKSCDGVGLRYEHLPELGIASEKRAALNNDADYQLLFDEYARTYLPHHNETLALVRRWADAGEAVALTCYERAPERCHRHCVAEELARTFGKRFEPRNL